MAEVDVWMTVLRNAHAAGDAAAAQRAAQRVRELRGAPSGVALRTGPDPFAGDDLLSDEAIARKAAGESITPSPEPAGYLSKVRAAARKANTVEGSAPVGTLETLGTVASGALAMPIASVAGIGAEAARGLGLTNARGEDVAERVQGALTYEPRTSSGRAQTGLLGAVVRPVSDSGADMALLPLAAGSPVLRAPKGAPRRTPKPDPIPTTEQLTKAAKDAYKAGKEAGVVVQPEGYASTLGKVRAMVTEEGIDPTLHPKSTAVMKRLEGANGRPLTLQEAETLRKIALDAEDDLNPVTREPTPDSRLAAKIVDELDDSLDELSTNAPARAMYARSRRSQLLDRMIHRAEIRAGAHYTQAGMEHALRQEFKTLALNPRRMRGFTPEQRAAIERVAKGGAIENGLRNLGKFDPTKGGMSTAISVGTGGFLAGMGNPIDLAVPAAGYLGRRAATRMTKRNVDAAREALVGRDPAVVPPIEKPVQKPAAMEGEVMPRQPLALPAPDIIAGSRSAPGTAYARREMGMTPDIEQAGALHPGAARETLQSGAPALPQRAAPAALEDRRPMVIDAQGRTASNADELSQYLRDIGQETSVPAGHPGQARPRETPPTLALPMLDQPAMVIDAQGRVAPTAAKLREYLEATGQEGLRNVRQPRAEPVSRPFGLVQAPQSPAVTSRGKRRSPAQILKEMQRVDAKAQKLPKDEPLNSPRMKAIAAQWEQLQLELGSRVPRA